MDLTISLIQSDLVWENISANLQNFSRKLEPLSGKTDLIVLPEMFTTGFTMNTATLAQPMDGPTMEWLAQKAAQTNAAIAGSFIAAENGKYYNRLVCMLPDASFHSYDKRHLFTLADEHLYFNPGKKKCIFTLKGWKICPLICYDLRFPVWSRNTDEYDLLLYVANFPEKRNHAWKTLLPARAVENQTYTIGLNRTGVDGNQIAYSGDSSLFDFEGKLLYQASYLEDTFTTSLSAQKQSSYRKNLQFLQDKDDFFIN